MPTPPPPLSSEQARDAPVAPIASKASATAPSKPPPNLHIAHRRSPSELTSLMIEQYNLQRQLNEVQAQQKQILQQQQQQQQQQQLLLYASLLQRPYVYPPPTSSAANPPNYAAGPPPGFAPSHSRSSSASYASQNLSGSGTHRRTGLASGNIQAPPQQGHARRHSLGLNEAIKAAATQRLANRSSQSSTTPQTQAQSNPVPPMDAVVEQDIGSFKFPAGPSHDSVSPGLGGGEKSHSRSRSLAHGQPFSFPAPPKVTSPPPIVDQDGGFRRGSHFRNGSRNFDPNGQVNMNFNWRSQQLGQAEQYAPPHQRQPSTLEPPAFVPGHGHRNSSYGGGNSFSSMSAMLGQGNQPPNLNNGRKSLFAPYLPQTALPELINEGRLVTGTLRVNKKNRSDAYVSTDGLLDADIFICGSKDRNRALEGDLVAVELLVVDEVWDSKKEKEEKKRRKDSSMMNKPGSVSVLNDDIHNDATSSTVKSDSHNGPESSGPSGASPTLGRRGSLKQRPTMKKNDDVEVEGQSLLLVEEEEINDEVKPLYAGHVVAVVDRIPSQLFSGSLGLLRPAQAAQAAKDKKDGKELAVATPRSPKIVWFKPIDKKVPLIAIPTDQAPKDFVDNHENYADQLFVATIKRWPITSLHPFGTLVLSLGSIEDSLTEVDSILRDNNFWCDEYHDLSLEDLRIDAPNFDEVADPSKTEKPRIEYNDDYIIAFSQDGQLSDHSLHVKRLLDQKIELGFHVPDIAHYVHPGSALDRKSKKRSASVVLPQKIEPLYPRELTNTIAFRENEKCLAISVVFEIDTRNFEIEKLLIRESVITPKQLVSYDTLDEILLEKLPPANITSATSDYAKTFSLIAKEFLRQRLHNRDLKISDSLSLLEMLDDEKVRLDLNIFKVSLAYNVINEISHKVNHAIASKVHALLGDFAFLRRQLLPTLQKMEAFGRKVSNLGFTIDTSSSATLQNSILRIADPVQRQCIQTLLFKYMLRAKYYVAGRQDSDSYGHYYFGLPLYTHFSAPLRRYADLVVHRQLKAVLASTPQEFDMDALKVMADYCNFKKDCASNAQQQAIHLLLSQTINELSGAAGQLLVMGTVLQVYESSFDVFIPEFGVEKRVHGDQLPLVMAEFDKTERILELHWEKGVDSATYIPPDERSSLSYRSSIKNKHRTSALQAAKFQRKSNLDKSSVVSTVEKLAAMNLSPPLLATPPLKTADGQGPDSNRDNTRLMPASPIHGGSGVARGLRTSSTSTLLSEATDATVNTLAPYLQDVVTRTDGAACIQQIRELGQVPVLIRAEIGMALPCLTVSILNPFSESH